MIYFATQKRSRLCSKPPCKELYFHIKTLWLHTEKSSCFPRMDFKTFGSESIFFGGLNVQVEALRTRRQRLCPLEHILQKHWDKHWPTLDVLILSPGLSVRLQYSTAQHHTQGLTANTSIKTLQRIDSSKTILTTYRYEEECVIWGWLKLFTYSSCIRILKSLFDFPFLWSHFQAHIFLFVKAVADLLQYLFISVFNRLASIKNFLNSFQLFYIPQSNIFPPSVTWSNYKEVTENCSNIYGILSGSVTL